MFKAKDNFPVENCFVLCPDRDPAAVAALTAYAKATDNKQLREDILNWITPDEKVVVLPCEIGTRCYRLVFKKSGRGKNASSNFVRIIRFKYSDLPDFGKTVFLTREAAEAALSDRPRNV